MKLFAGRCSMATLISWSPCSPIFCSFVIRVDLNTLRRLAAALVRNRPIDQKVPGISGKFFRAGTANQGHTFMLGRE